MSGTTFNLGQYNEVLVAVARALPKALEGMDPKSVITACSRQGEALSQLLKKGLDVLVVSSVFSRDMRKEGWELVEDVSEPATIVIADLEVISFLREGEGSVSGDVMRQRAIELGANLGHRHAEFLLGAQEEIPAEFRKFFLVFPGTVWRGSDGDGSLYVSCISCRGGRWGLYFGWLGAVWPSHGRLLRPRK